MSSLDGHLDRMLAEFDEHGVPMHERLAKVAVERALAGDKKFREMVLRYKDAKTNTIARHFRRLLDEVDEHGVSVEKRLSEGQKNDPSV